MLGNIHSIETFGSADGPGVRYLNFFERAAICAANTAIIPIPGQKPRGK